ncbi:hypothetical protein B7463_g5845, partial [Scytalidium lignicola]
MDNITPCNYTYHPYHPPGLNLSGYLGNELSVPVLLSLFAACCAGILAVTRSFVGKVHPLLQQREKGAIWWFILSGSIHLFFEGYFSINHTRMASSQDLFGQLWKEYALSDSRYLTSDPFVLCMETVTAFIWGPLCYIVAAFITTQHPLRHPLQIIVCVGQIYGLILYYATSMFDHFYHGLTYSRPEFLYFWGYYFFMNFIWMVFPGMLLYSSVATSARAFKAFNTAPVLQKDGGALEKPNGNVEKKIA